MEKRASLVNLTESVRENIREKLIVLGVFDNRTVENFKESSKLCGISAGTLWAIWHDYEKKKIQLSTYQSIQSAYHAKCIEKNIKPTERVGASKPRGALEYVNCSECQEPQAPEYEKLFDCSPNLNREKELVGKLRDIMMEFNNIALILEREFVTIEINKNKHLTYDVFAKKIFKTEVEL